MMQTDEELIKEYLSGDETSFQELMQRTLKPIFNFVFQYVRDTETAEDIVQDTFLKAWKNLKKFDRDKKWKPWIFAIARNTTLDQIKKRKVVPFSDLDSPIDTDSEYAKFSEALEDAEPLASELFENAENARELATALSSLRPKYHSVLLLHYYQEMTFEEIANVMDIPLNTAKSWHYRALREIKAILITKRDQVKNPI